MTVISIELSDAEVKAVQVAWGQLPEWPADVRGRPPLMALKARIAQQVTGAMTAAQKGQFAPPLPPAGADRPSP